MTKLPRLLLQQASLIYLCRNVSIRSGSGVECSFEIPRYFNGSEKRLKNESVTAVSIIFKARYFQDIKVYFFCNLNRQKVKFPQRAAIFVQAIPAASSRFKFYSAHHISIDVFIQTILMSVANVGGLLTLCLMGPATRSRSSENTQL